MKVVLAGGTGFIGASLVRQLVEDGHECTVLIRTSFTAPETFPKGIRLAPYSDLPDVADAVINLAGEPIAGWWTKNKMARIVDTRVDITHILVKWMEGLAVKPSVFLSASAVGFYGDRGQEIILDETGPDPKRGFLCLVCIAWEREANEARKAGIRVVNLRFGNVLDPGGGMLKQMADKFKRAPFVAPHSMSAAMPWISLADTLGIIRFGLEHDSVSGPVNVVSPATATWAEFYAGLGLVLKKKVVGKLPHWVLKLAVGKMAEVLAESQRIVPEKIVHAGYVFQDVDLSAYLGGVKMPQAGKKR